MGEIKLPLLLETKLSLDAGLRCAVDRQRHYFAEWFRDSKMPFFPDYTDHGITHVESVLATSCALVPEEARLHFTPADAAILTLSILFHDCAMHLTEAGFYELVRGEYSRHMIPSFDATPWDQVWDDFLFKARRWDDEQCIAVFGSDECDVPLVAVRDPLKHRNNLQETDKKLIGEFIRQHHARLAHHASVYGVPGVDGLAISPSNELTPEQRDLAGLVARSHGLPIRKTLDYLATKYHRREFQQTHAVFLMAVLRVADYLQVDASRTSAIAFQYKYIPSKVSQIEHKAHLAVRNITATHEDPESLEIQTKPAEVKVFLRLKEWLNGIQAEIDASWAVLGEVYGSHPELRQLGLKFRRVRSNLDDVTSFAQGVPFLPARIRFDVARAELLKLLIRPLYGDDPSYGVREMMQNAIDAVRELEVYLNEHPELLDVPRRRQQHDVEVRLSALDDFGEACMMVSDRGVGMTEEVIRYYFLRAGASFRKSEQWKEHFERDGITAENSSKSKVLRSGRFGIGALGAFLIGHEIEVETRHITSNDGFRFKTALETEAISVEKDSSIPVGTSIRIRLNSETHSRLKKSIESARRPKLWDWYTFSKPSVARFLPDRKRATLTGHRGDLFDSDLLWRKLDLPLPYQVYWTQDKGVPKLTCNGIFVNNGTAIQRVDGGITGLHGWSDIFHYPAVAILDPDGHFPLSLQRNDLSTDDYPFASELVRNVLLEMIAWLFFHGPNAFSPSNLQHVHLGQWLNPWGAASRVVLTRCGFGLDIASCLCNIKVSRAIFCEKPGSIAAILDTDCIFFDSWSDGRAKRGERYWYRWPEPHFENPADASSDAAFALRRVLWQRRSKKASASHVIQDLPNGWKMVSDSKCPESGFRLGSLPKRSKDDGDTELLTEVFFEHEVHLRGRRWFLDNLWEELFGEELLPYDQTERIKRFPKAAEKLKRFNVKPELNIRETRFGNSLHEVSR